MPIVINLPPEVEAQLQERAAREGQDIDFVAAEILTEVLASEAQELQESIKGIQRGLDDFEAGRYRSFREFAEEKYRKYNLGLQEVMDDMSQEAQARGLTPEILQSLLNDE